MKHLDDFALYSLLLKDSPSSLPACPSCNAPASSFRRNGAYYRYLVYDSQEVIYSQRIPVPSLKCSSCKKSHALLPSLLIPYSSYSLSFILSLLYARLTRRFPSILALCEHFGISESSFYRFRKRFTLDSRELIRFLGSFMEAFDLLYALHSCEPFLLHSSLQDFFLSSGYSFLQPCVRLRPRLPIRSIPPGFYQIT